MARLIDADALIYALGDTVFTEDGGVDINNFIDIIKRLPTIKAYTIEDLQDAFRDGQDNECLYHWGIRKAELWYMCDEVLE